MAKVGLRGSVFRVESRYHDIRNVINLSGQRRVQKRKPRFRITKESLMECLNTDMHQACFKIDKECRVLTVHGTNDEIVLMELMEDAKEFAKNITSWKNNKEKNEKSEIV
ncbi:hypothetical protein AALP_AA8G122800 [Arabis alpina]|uniref:Uncharacterized protein n=1 Tax=Arabis alpina TaxID=50452 RepID=A0A087G6J9_ARAAL|nr:hypothetical protein AALP_AA8G122800 [Arabis alpina]